MPRTFLIVEHNPEGQFLLSKTLKRKFPEADIRASHEASQALEMVRNENLDAIIVHRSADADGVATIRQIIEAKPSALIIMVSGYDRRAEALTAGAAAFLNYDEWLRLGTVVAEEIAKRGSPGE